MIKQAEKTVFNSLEHTSPTVYRWRRKYMFAKIKAQELRLFDNSNQILQIFWCYQI